MWDKRYASDEYVYGVKPNDFLKECVSKLPQKGRALCLAEGEGRNAVFLAECGFEVTAVDSSTVGLQKAERLASSRGLSIQTHHADLADFDLGSNQWDLIVSIFCHVPIEIRQRLHASVNGALVPGGSFVLEAYTPEQIAYGTGGPPVADLMMDLMSLYTELEGLSIVQALEQVRDIQEGCLHNGEGAVVQLLGECLREST